MDLLIHLAVFMAIYAVLGISLNLLVGYTGLLSVTHAAFFGIGAYATALLLTRTGVPFFLSMLIGALIAMGVAFFIGLVLSQFKDDYYALASLGFNVIVYSIFLNWQNLTKGPFGIPGIPRPVIFGVSFSSNALFLAPALGCLIVIYLVSRFIVNSSFGRVLKAIREEEEVTQLFGYRTPYFKLAIFVVTAGMAAAAGSLFASYLSFIDPSTFTITESIFILSIIILGGLANLTGSILGAFILILLPEILRFLGFPMAVAGQIRQAVYGLLLILLMLYRPQGLLGEYKL